MKRRLLSAFLAVMMVLTMAPVAFAGNEDAGSSTAVAKIGDTTYESLNAAIAAVQDDETIELLKNVDHAEGMSVNTGKTFTVDFKGHTYTVSKPGAGSKDTETNAFQLITGQNITFKNGTICLAEDNLTASVIPDTSPVKYSNIRRVIQCYAALTLEDMTIDATNVFGSAFPMSFNNQPVNITGNTSVILKPGTTTAFDADGNWGPYGRCTVTVNTTGTIDGDLELGSGYLDIKNVKARGVHFCTSCGSNETTDQIKRISITGGTFATDVSAYVAEGYVQNENGTVEQLGATNAVAEVGNTYYKTLADAVAAAKADEATTITLLKDVELPSYIYIKDKKNITLDLNGKNITRTGNGVFYVGNAKLRVTGTGTIFENQRDGFAPIIAKGSPNDVADYTTITIDENVTLKGDYAGIFVDTDTAGKNSYHNYGLVINMKGSIDLTAIDGGVSAYGVYVQGLNKITSGNVMQINLDGVTINTGDEAIYAAGYAKWNVKNCTFNAENAAIEVRAGDMTIDGGVYTAMASEFKCEANGNGSTTQGAALAIMQHTTKLPISVYVKNGVFHSAAAVAEKNIQKNDPKPNVDLQIADGQFNGVVVADDVLNFISGGYFTTDPSAYVASGYVAGTSDVSGYSYKVVKKTETGNVEVKPAVAKPEVKVDKIPQADQEKVAAAAATVSAPTLGAAAADEAQKIDKTKADELVAKANEVTGETSEKKLYVQSALKVEPTAYNSDKKELALEITPQYRVVASTATTANEIKLDGNTKNAQVVQDYQNMTIDTPTEVTMELPTGFAVDDGAKLSIQHTKNGTVEYYTGTVTKKDDKLYLTFTTNGFSPFVISVPAAAIESKVYPTLQAAVDSAKNGDVIDLYKDVAADTKVTVAKTIKFKIATNSNKFDAAKNIVAGSNTTVKVTGESSPYTYEFTYTKPSSSSSGGSSSGKTTYKVTTSAVNNGGVNASPSSAEKGATITLTLSPDKGYKLDKLTVTDGSGKSVSTVKKSDTVYTFTMPASAVKVGVSYVKATETPSETKFNDVSANDWFASAVDYVTGKGMMNGTAANTFSPKANTTRGMLMTVLARHAGEDTTGGSVWYEKGMNWAKANGVSDGTNPQVNITREQLAAMLYRYAQNKKYDVSGAKSLDGYTDAQSVSSYAVPALQWANAAGVVTGKSGSKLDPKGYATRAEVAAMLMRFCENVEK